MATEQAFQKNRSNNLLVICSFMILIFFGMMHDMLDFEKALIKPYGHEPVTNHPEIARIMYSMFYSMLIYFVTSLLAVILYFNYSDKLIRSSNANVNMFFGFILVSAFLLIQQLLIYCLPNFTN